MNAHDRKLEIKTVPETRSPRDLLRGEAIGKVNKK